MRAELRSLHAPEADGGELNAFQPDDAEDFGVFVQAFVGPAGESGEESFGFTVCTAPWLARQDLPKGFAFERGILRLERWDPAVVDRAVSDLSRHTEGSDWQEVAQKLSRYGGWEFEDYDPVVR